MMLLHYLKVAVRQLLKYRTQNLISIVGLGVCLLCFSICLYVGRFILDTDSCFENRDRIADIQLENEFGEPYGNACIPLAHRLAAQLPAGVEAVTYVNVSEERDYTLTLPSGRELPYQELYTLEVDSSFQRVFGAEVLAGSWEAAAHTPNAIILTERLAARLFDHPAEAIGCRMVLTNTRRMPTTRESGVTGNVSYTVQAVIRDFPLNNSLTQMQPVDLLTVNDELSYLNVYRQADYILSGQLYALLRPGITPAQLTGRFRQENLKASFGPEESPVVAVPFGRLFWQEGPYRLFAVIALALGTLILLVGLVNFFNLACGSYLNRLREYSLRRVTGSRGRQLLGLLFTQAGLTVLLAFLVTGCLAELAASHLHIFLGSFSLDIERGVLLGQCAQYLAAVLLLTGMVCAGTVAYAVLGVRRAGRCPLSADPDGRFRHVQFPVRAAEERDTEHPGTLFLHGGGGQTGAHRPPEATRRRGRLPDGGRDLYQRDVGHRPEPGQLAGQGATIRIALPPGLARLFPLHEPAVPARKDDARLHGDCD